jgi:hypothetical protein
VERAHITCDKRRRDRALLHAVDVHRPLAPRAHECGGLPRDLLPVMGQGGKGKEGKVKIRSGCGSGSRMNEREMYKEKQILKEEGPYISVADGARFRFFKDRTDPVM